MLARSVVCSIRRVKHRSARFLSLLRDKAKARQINRLIFPPPDTSLGGDTFLLAALRPLPTNYLNTKTYQPVAQELLLS